jgi:protein CpxP
MNIRSIGRPALLAVALASLAATLPAHQPKQEGGPGGVPRMFRRMARALDLTEAQRSQVRGVLESHAPEIRAQRKAGIESRRALRQAAAAQPADEAAIRDLAAQLGNVQGNRAVLFSRIRTEILPILTAEQQEKWKQIQARRRPRG